MFVRSGAHQNTLEDLPIIVANTLIGGVTHPVVAAALCGTWVFSRILYTIGYSTGDPAKVRTRFATLDKRLTVGHSVTGWAVLRLVPCASSVSLRPVSSTFPPVH